MKKINLIFAAIFIAFLSQAQTVATFENLALVPDTFWNGSDLSGGFNSGNARFANSYDTTYQAWSGFSYSNMSDSTTPGYGNQYSAITAAGYGGSGNYAVADEYGNAKIYLTGTATGGMAAGFYVTNATLDYLSMLNGDAFAKKFGPNDWLKLTAKAWYNGVLKNDSVDFYLADFRFADTTQNYILKTWQWVNLSTLGNADSIIFHLSSTDNSQYGMNTPAYFCIDNFTTADRSNPAPVVSDGSITINYEQDTLINVISNYTVDSFNVLLTVHLINGPTIDGASALVDSANNIWYIPTIGVVAQDIITYSVCDIDNQCDTAQIAINVTGLTGVSAIASFENRIYPNPFSNSFFISHKSGTKEIRMYDLEGRLIKEVSCNPVETNTEINACSLAAGTYLIKLISAEGSTIAKITKQ